MRNTGTLQVTLKNDCEVVLTRVFNAPRAMVFEAMTKPELLKRWMGPRGWSLIVSEIDLRVGGRWRSVLRSPEGQEMGMSGVYREIDPPERIVSTEVYDDYPGETVNTLLLREENGKTTFTCTILYPSKNVRDTVIASGMEHGAAECYDRLAEVLEARAHLSLESRA
ncbi:MAG: ATPase [Acidobacteria bacterium]|nr:MAG: ATPase [Acidobacteriota bacterium]PYU69297.1 MAG: ATPase [Acidobacteriota bacterium]